MAVAAPLAKSMTLCGEIKAMRFLPSPSGRRAGVRMGRGQDVSLPRLRFGFRYRYATYRRKQLAALASVVTTVVNAAIRARFPAAASAAPSLSRNADSLVSVSGLSGSSSTALRKLASASASLPSIMCAGQIDMRRYARRRKLDRLLQRRNCAIWPLGRNPERAQVDVERQARGLRNAVVVEGRGSLNATKRFQLNGSRDKASEIPRSKPVSRRICREKAIAISKLTTSLFRNCFRLL